MEQDLIRRLPVPMARIIFGFLPIKERVKCELVSKSWKEILDGLWLSQKQLQIGSRDGTAFDCHPISKLDTIEEEYNYHALEVNHLPINVTLDLISRCKNLEVLNIYSAAFRNLRDNENIDLAINFATELANVINSCEKLKHLDIVDVNLPFFGLFKPSDKFTCLLPTNNDRLELLYNNQSPVRPISLKMVDFSKTAFGRTTMNMIDPLAVEYLFAKRWNNLFNELVNLKRLHVLRAESGQVGDFERLQEMSLLYSSAAGLRRILEKNPQLRSLKLGRRGEEVISILSNYGRKTKNLDIEINTVDIISRPRFWRKMCKLTQLTDLQICARQYEDFDSYLDGGDEDDIEGDVVNTKLNVNGLISLLTACTKLENFYFRCYSSAMNITTEEEKELIREVFAGKPFEVTFRRHGDGHSISIVSDGYRGLRRQFAVDLLYR